MSLTRLAHRWDLTVVTIEDDGGRRIRAGNLAQIRIPPEQLAQAKKPHLVLDWFAAMLDEQVTKQQERRREAWEAYQRAGPQPE